MSTTLTSRPIPSTSVRAEADATARWPGAVALVALGVLVLIVGVVFVAIDQTQRDANGFLMNPPSELRTETAALVASEPQAGGDNGLRYEIMGDSQLTVRSAREVFVGIASASAVERYLTGVAVEHIDDLADTSGTPTPGRAANRPAAQRIWAAAISGRDRQTLRWKATEGRWRVVVMNADGSPDVQATVAIGARHPSYISLTFGLGLLGGGAMLLFAGVLMMPLHRGVPQAPTALRS